LQRHQQRSEHWVVVKGEATITRDQEKFNLTENQSTYIKKNQAHQIENRTDQTLQIIEVQSGNYLGEDDIQRLEDKYGR
jgi:mannose-6-phosphate isomerase-like protein (cupin superfamily)